MMFKHMIFLIFIPFFFFSHILKAQDNNQSDPLIVHAAKTWTDDLDTMIKKRMIRVLVIPSDIMFHIDKVKKSGFSYDYMLEFEKQINAHFPQKNKHLKTDIVFIPVSKDQLIPGLLEGRGDIAMADISITPKRKRKIDFSDPYASKINAIVVTGPSAKNINTKADLAGKEVYVQRSSSYYEYLEKMNFYFIEVGLHPIRIKAVPEQLEDKEILEFINTGIIGITVVDDYKARLWSKVLKELVLHPKIILKENDEFAWMIRKNSPQLLKEINLFMQEHKAGTTLGNILINRHVKNFNYDKHEINKKNLHSFDEMFILFQKYAEKYELNTLLMLAQGYQESKLDQKVKSDAGAIGIMQLMPKTGESMKVGNIHKLENNIHAGFKYHRYLMDRYFTDASMDHLNQTLFTFAAYNGGPSRIISLRKTAKEKGYDPNIWFDNVEIIALEKIGVETANYVTNIYQYYVAYFLYKEQKERKLQSINKVISSGKL